ncbi:MAG: transglutaminase domain-containing protein [Candidatus Levyibacteriota bacterium]|nr:MAG: transglutaminase domain-containing protein [Candidatus Levybacteria bacterium]
MNKILLIIIFFFIFQFLTFNSQLASALELYKISYDTTYTVKEDGLTHVLFQIVLTNTTSQNYPTSYKVKVEFSSIDNISAFDPDGIIKPHITKTQDGQTIELIFNKKVVGKDKKLPFSLSFTTSDVAKKHGRKWEVNIPPISHQNNFEDYNVRIKVPSSFGTPAYIKPNNYLEDLYFTKELLGKSGISISFGDKQYYSYKLTYHLQNKFLFPTYSEIAIPPTTNYQRVIIDDIAPKPINVREDLDGNWLAQYLLTPGKKIDVVVQGRAEVSFSPSPSKLNQELKALYLVEKPYWEIDWKMKDKAIKLKTPKNIYNYVVNNLTYDFSRVSDNLKRLGAKEVFYNGTSAVCLEFTDLFVALSRAAGIPAREIDGFAYTQNQKQRPLSKIKDILHAWPEYYDEERQMWIMVDPTWGNTTSGIDYFHTLDFDHLAFVIKGANSQYPIPAGGYKIKGLENIKDVQVSFASKFLTNEKSAITIQLKEKESSIGIFLIMGGIFGAIFTIIILFITPSFWHLPFFRRKR